MPSVHAAYAKATEFDGQVSGEHGIGHAKKQYLRESLGDTSIELMAGIKQVFEPQGHLESGQNLQLRPSIIVCNEPAGTQMGSGGFLISRHTIKMSE